MAIVGTILRRNDIIVNDNINVIKQEIYINIYLIIFFVCQMGLFCQISHAAAHGRWTCNGQAETTIKGKIVTLLQKYKLFISVEDHHVHHSNFESNFSIINGWSNPLVNYIFKNFYEPTIQKDCKPKLQRTNNKKLWITILSSGLRVNIFQCFFFLR